MDGTREYHPGVESIWEAWEPSSIRPFIATATNK